MYLLDGSRPRTGDRGPPGRNHVAPTLRGHHRTEQTGSPSYDVGLSSSVSEPWPPQTPPPSVPVTVQRQTEEKEVGSSHTRVVGPSSRGPTLRGRGGDRVPVRPRSGSSRRVSPPVFYEDGDVVSFVPIGYPLAQNKPDISLVPSPGVRTVEGDPHVPGPDLRLSTTPPKTPFSRNRPKRPTRDLDRSQEHGPGQRHRGWSVKDSLRGLGTPDQESVPLSPTESMGPAGPGTVRSTTAE